MVDIILKETESGYAIIGDYIFRFWENRGYGDVLVSLGVSHDGINYDVIKEVAVLYNYTEVEFMGDWWEGEQYIKLFGIKLIDEVDISGGIYES